MLFQVRFDYLRKNDPSARVDTEIAVQLCCLQIRCFFREVPQMSLEKKSNLEYLEREVYTFIFYIYYIMFILILLFFFSSRLGLTNSCPITY